MAKSMDIDLKIKEMAGRIRELRLIEGYSPEEMAAKTDVSAEEYLKCENGEADLNFAFIYRCAAALRVNVTDIIEGFSPNLKSYTVTRAGTGQQIAKAHGMVYHNMAYAFKNRIAEPLYVISSYDPDAQSRDIELTTHEGQECDIVIEGNLMVQVGEHKEVLGPGDSIYYNSSTPHGMIAVNGKDCKFYAIVLRGNVDAKEAASDIVPTEQIIGSVHRDTRDRVYHKFIDIVEDEQGTPTSITFKNADKFNFAFDLVDELSKREPEKLAMLHIAKDGTERRFTFTDMRRLSSQCANYFASLGIKKGDRVMLILKRHYQFWIAMLGLNKLGAVAIPAVDQLHSHDLEYRFEAAGISAVVCTADSEVSHHIDTAAEGYDGLKVKMMVGGARDDWRDFDEEYKRFSSHFERTEDSPCGDDLLLMYFTSGTSGYPKIAAHSHKYPLGHFHTAKYWHNVDPDGLHFTISDTGWAKAMWGKLYGQWLCEAATFVYDFARFYAADNLPMFAKYHITTFCAPPTMLRMMVKQDISQYDLSSVRHMTTAGEALNPEVYRQFEKATGLQIKEGFGQSETTMIIGNLVGKPHKIGSMGKPAPIYDVELLDADGNPVSTSEEGEICINLKNGSPCGLALGYYGDEEKTNETWQGGYYHTGDVAWRDEDGYYWYVGRVDDVIKSSGYRIGPFEIESVIMELPYVLECGVSAVPDEVRGQIVKASIVLVNGTQESDDLKVEIQNYVKEKTAPYKYPRIVEFKESLPKTVSGKIIRRQL